MIRFTARCLDSADCGAVMHNQGCDSIRANTKAPLNTETVQVSEYLNEWHTYDLDDTSPVTGAPWCLDCDDYARCGDWHPEA